MAKPAYKIFEYRKSLENEGLYETNMLYYLAKFVNEVRRMREHYSGRDFKFLATSDFIAAIEKYQLLTDDGKFYEDKTVTVELINDNTLKKHFKITH